jgi:hypothetical protein
MKFPLQFFRPHGAPQRSFWSSDLLQVVSLPHMLLCECLCKLEETAICSHRRTRSQDYRIRGPRDDYCPQSVEIHVLAC